jgi:hypothetical protein
MGTVFCQAPAEKYAEVKVLSLDFDIGQGAPRRIRVLKNRRTGNREVVRDWNTKIHALTTGDATLVKLNLLWGMLSTRKR